MDHLFCPGNSHGLRNVKLRSCAESQVRLALSLRTDVPVRLETGRARFWGAVHLSGRSSRSGCKKLPAVIEVSPGWAGLSNGAAWYPYLSLWVARMASCAPPSERSLWAVFDGDGSEDQLCHAQLHARGVLRPQVVSMVGLFVHRSSSGSTRNQLASAHMFTCAVALCIVQ